VEEALAYFLDLRGRLCVSPEAWIIVDRCVGMLTRAARADAASLADIEAEIDELRADLEARFGRRSLVRH